MRGERVDVGRARLRLHANHAHALERARQREADAAREPATAKRHHDQLQVRRLAGELEPDRALARHHLRLVEGVHRA